MNKPEPKGSSIPDKPSSSDMRAQDRNEALKNNSEKNADKKDFFEDQFRIIMERIKANK